MQKYRVLVLTDHAKHSVENSIYLLLKAMRKNPLCGRIDVASRSIPQNRAFFQGDSSSHIWAAPVTQDFAYSSDGQFFIHKLEEVEISSYDLVWLRLPPPLTRTFLHFIYEVFQETFVMNDPKGIYETGSKEFLTRFPELCPPMQICTSKEDILKFSGLFPIVLKPFREYGGKGIVRIDGNQAWVDNKRIRLEQFLSALKEEDTKFLGVKFLKNVDKGDKRIIVINGKIMGASLRLPAEGSWLCNVAMGGSSNFTTVDADEIKIIETVNPVLAEMGIVMYGVDTLVNDEGKRVLSEINTTSIGGLPQISQLTKGDLLKEAVSLIWEYFIKYKTERS